MQHKATVDEMSVQASANQQKIATGRNEQLISGDGKSIRKSQWSWHPHSAATTTNGNIRLFK